MNLCKRCKKEKPTEAFGNRKTAKDGIKSWCKECESEQAKLRRQKNPEHTKEINRKSRLKNIERRLEETKKWREKNIEHIKEYQREYRKREDVKERRRKEAEINRRENGIPKRTKMNKEEYLRKANERAKKYYKGNKQKINEYKKQWIRKKLEFDIQFRLRRRISTRIYHALKGTVKSKDTIKLIGCSIEYLMTHLESQFDKGMTWENYGEWHVDHIIPCAHFDLTKDVEQKICFNYKNLQPLRSKENMYKGAKLILKDVGKNKKQEHMPIF